MRCSFTLNIFCHSHFFPHYMHQRILGKLEKKKRLEEKGYIFFQIFQ